jgi:hypothetical protein
MSKSTTVAKKCFCMVPYCVMLKMMSVKIAYQFFFILSKKIYYLSCKISTILLDRMEIIVFFYVVSLLESSKIYIIQNVFLYLVLAYYVYEKVIFTHFRHDEIVLVKDEQQRILAKDELQLHEEQPFIQCMTVKMECSVDESPNTVKEEMSHQQIKEEPDIENEEPSLSPALEESTLVECEVDGADKMEDQRNEENKDPYCR